jgi:hypothetical protein
MRWFSSLICIYCSFIYGFFNCAVKCHRLYSVEWWDDRWSWIGKYLEGSSRGQTAVLSQDLPGRSKANHENLVIILSPPKYKSDQHIETPSSGFKTVHFGEGPKFQRNVLPPSSNLKSKPSFLTALADLLLGFNLRHWRWRRYFPPKRRAVSKLHGITIQKIVLFIVTTIRTAKSMYRSEVTEYYMCIIQ